MTSSEVIPSVLTSWKEIAQYLGKGVRTVQRWEREYGLPVRRPAGISHKSPVGANPKELDAWLETTWSARNGNKTSNVPLSADEALLSGELPLMEVIQASRELRLARKMLQAQISVEAKTLKKNCAELNERLKS
jgi:hypothetical protein